MEESIISNPLIEKAENLFSTIKQTINQIFNSKVLENMSKSLSKEFTEQNFRRFNKHLTTKKLLKLNYRVPELFFSDIQDLKNLNITQCDIIFIIEVILKYYHESINENIVDK